MKTSIIILLSIVSLPIAILFVTGLYYLCIAGILRLATKTRTEFYNYSKERIHLIEDIKKVHKQNVADMSKNGDVKTLCTRKKIKDNYVCKALLTASVTAVIFIAASIFLSKYYGLYISFDNIVLTFVGILATFVVVTNYAQVLEIKKELHSRIDAINLRNRRLGNRITHPEKYDKPQNHAPKAGGGTNRKNIKSDTTKRAKE